MDTTTRMLQLAARVTALDEALAAFAAAEGDGGGKPMRTARRLTAELGEAIADLTDREQRLARPARVAPQPAGATGWTTRQAARAVVSAGTTDEALWLAGRLAGRQLAEVADLLGVHLSGTVAQRRRQLVEQTLGRQLRQATLATPRRPDGSRDQDAAAATVAAWRQRVLPQLDG